MQKLKQNLMKKFPSIIRWKQPILHREVYYLVILGVFAFIYFYFHYFLAKMPLTSSVREACIRTFVLILSYKLLKEISPDMQNHYYFCLMMTGCSMCYPGKVYAFSILFILLTSRMITRSSGCESSDFELGFLVIIGFILHVISSFVYAIHLSIALLIDYFFDNEARKKNLPPAFLMAVLASMWFLRFFGMKQISLSYIWIFIVISSSILFIYRISILHHILSMDDLNQRLLQPGRIKGANANLVVTMLVFAIADGKVAQFAPIWILMLSVSLPYIKDIYLIWKEDKRSEENAPEPAPIEEEDTLEEAPKKNYPKIILSPQLETYNRFYLKSKEEATAPTEIHPPEDEDSDSEENDEAIPEDSSDKIDEVETASSGETENKEETSDKENDENTSNNEDEVSRDSEIDEGTSNEEDNDDSRNDSEIDKDTFSEDDAHGDNEIDKDSFSKDDNDAYDNSEIDEDSFSQEDAYNDSEIDEDAYDDSEIDEDAYDNSEDNNDTYNDSEIDEDAYDNSEDNNDAYDDSEIDEDAYDNSEDNDDAYDDSEIDEDAYDNSEDNDDAYDDSEIDEDAFSEDEDDAYGDSEIYVDVFNDSEISKDVFNNEVAYEDSEIDED